MNDCVADVRSLRRRRRFAGWAKCARVLAVALAIVLAGAPRPASAQATSAALGLVGGLVGGVHVSTGIFVFKARAYGFNLHTAEDILTVRPETLPILVMPLAGGILGYRSSTRLAGAATWSAVGLAGGAITGAVLGHFIGGTSEWRWAGGTVGSAAGLVLGGVLGALFTSGDSNDERTPATVLLPVLSIPL